MEVMKAAVLGAIAFFIDGVVLATGAIGIIVVFMLPVVLVRAVREKKDLGKSLAATGIYLLSAVLIFLSVYINNSTAFERAEGIIAACETYREANGEYPDSLYDLIPGQLESIPRARYALAFNNFGYVASANGHQLSFMVLPPLGVSFYVLEEGRWGFSG